MKVICVTKQDFSGEALCEFPLEVGDEFIVLRECIGYGRFSAEVPCYDFVETAHTEYLFDKRNFATLPDTSADEMAKAEQEAILM